MSKTTGALSAYKMINALPIGASFTTESIMKKMPKHVTKSSVGNLVWRMKKDGCIDRVPGEWRYITTEKTKHFGARKWNGTYNVADSIAKPKRGSNKSTFARDVAQATINDLDIIDNLLDAMATAEPVLKKYKKMHTLLAEFVE